MQRLLHGGQTDTQPSRHSGKAGHPWDHLRLIALLPEQFHQIAICGVDRHIPQHHHGHILPSVKNLPDHRRCPTPSRLTHGQIPRHGKRQRQDFFARQIHRPPGNRQSQLLPPGCLSRSNHWAGLQHPACLSGQQFRVTRAHAYSEKNSSSCSHCFNTSWVPGVLPNSPNTWENRITPTR